MTAPTRRHDDWRRAEKPTLQAMRDAMQRLVSKRPRVNFRTKAIDWETVNTSMPEVVKVLGEAAGINLASCLQQCGQRGGDNVKHVPAGIGLKTYRGHRPDYTPIWTVNGSHKTMNDDLALWTLDQLRRGRGFYEYVAGPLYASPVAKAALDLHPMTIEQHRLRDVLQHESNYDKPQLDLRFGEWPNSGHAILKIRYNLIRAVVRHQDSKFEHQGNRFLLRNTQFPLAQLQACVGRELREIVNHPLLESDLAIIKSVRLDDDGTIAFGITQSPPVLIEEDQDHALAA